MTFLIFYDLDQNKIVDQIYGGQKYLGHTQDGCVYCIVTNYYDVQDWKGREQAFHPFSFEEDLIDKQNRTALKKRKLG